MYILTVLYASGWYALSETFETSGDADRFGREIGKTYYVSAYRATGCDCWQIGLVCDLCEDDSN